VGVGGQRFLVLEEIMQIEIGAWLKERRYLPPTPRCNCPGRKIYDGVTHRWWCPKCQNGKRKRKEVRRR